ncbi:MAG: single-stranded DNA-binding protein [Melioribacteraceae bacterium]|nr:single-stranded DNA-binding protein [Melioribacteraceae bacterium]
MAFSLNKIMLIGRIGKDPETRFTTSNVEVTSFSMVTDHSYKGKDGQWQKEATWHNIVAFNLSDYMKQNLGKGKRVYVEGRIRTREYEDNQGVKKYFTEVIADTFSMIPLDAGGSAGGGDTSYSRNNVEEPLVGQEPKVDVASGNPDDDLPF